MLVNEFLERPAALIPDKIALVCGNQRLTYKQINSCADTVAAFLVKTGVKRHDRVSILLDSSVESIIALFGILKTGAIFIMLSPTMKSAKLNYVLKDSGSCLLISHINKYTLIKESTHGAAELKHVIWCKGEKDINGDIQLENPIFSVAWDSIFESDTVEKPVEYPVPIDIDLSNIIYTSGSTGEPKGVMSAHYNVVSATRSISTYLRMNDKDIVMNVLPLSFDYGLYQVFITFFSGGTLILEKSFIYPYKALEKLVLEKVTGFPIVPTIASLILEMNNLSNFDFSSLRYISNTAAALPFTFIRRLQTVFPHSSIYSMYGLTECKRVSYLPPEDIERKPGSVGIAMPNEEIFIVGENGNELEANEIGELVIRGSNVMQGYWNDPVTTAKVFRQGRYPGETLLYSGDLFRKDDEGYLYFVSRKDDMIKTKGERVSPMEIEASLHEMEGVSEVAVFGIPDNVYGQAIVAYIVPKKGLAVSAQNVRKYCAHNLELFMVPKYVEFIDEFPKSASGKIDKKLIAENFIKDKE